MASRRSRKRSASRLTHKEIYLDRHDEEKVLLFTAGLLFGVGVAASLFSNALWYGGLVAIALAAVLLLIEKRQ
ncbi:MAG: hypothetical protein HYY37_06465 [Candidatus Aenigmarchaeota archaeon]|nr:hypothetical protein [Candidatus Aenigmarchaeota archaeon]